MDLRNITILLTSFIEFILGFLVFLNYQGKRVKVVFTLLVLSVLLWGFFMVFYRLSTDVDIALFWLKFVYAVGPVLAPLFYIYFTFTFVRQNLYPKIINAIFAIPASILFILVFYSDFIIGGVILETGREGTILFGSLYYIYALYIVSYFIIGYINLFRSYRVETDNITRVQLSYVFAGTFLSSVTAVIIDLILPTLGVFQLVWLGPILTITLVVFIFYAIFKHHLLDIKLIGTEIFVSLLVIVLFVNIFVYNTPTELIIKIGIFIAGLIISTLLILASLRELTQREEIETLNIQLQKSVEELRKLDELKTEFVSLASHQLRTPLTPIKGFSDMLRRGEIGGPLNEEQRDAVEKVYVSSQRMVELIDDLLDVSKLEKEGGFTYNFIVSNPSDLVKSIVDELQPQAAEKGLSLSFNSKLLPSVKVKFDARRLKDAVENVVTNSIRYTLKGSVWVNLFEEEEEWVTISIKDTGIGIYKDDMPKIFQKFFRGKEVSRLATEGTGLGLYFTRRVVEDHGGHIWVESEGLEKGSEFIIKLPKVV